MPKSHRGHKPILCVIDEMTNYLITMPIYQPRAEEIGDALKDNVISKYGIPEYMVMDQDNTFMSTIMSFLFKRLNIKMVAPFNHQSLQTEHGIRSLSSSKVVISGTVHWFDQIKPMYCSRDYNFTSRFNQQYEKSTSKSLSSILTKHLTKQGQMWPKFLTLAMLAYNTFNSPNLANYSPYELVLGRNPKILLDFETDPDIKISGTFTDYYQLLEKRLKYLQDIL